MGGVHTANGHHRMRARPAGIDTYQQPVIYMRGDCHVCRAEGFEAQSQVEVAAGERRILATLHAVNGEWLPRGEAALSEVAWRMLGLRDGDSVEVGHPPVLESLRHIRAKVFGHVLDESAMRELMHDVSAGRLSDLHLAAFITACAGNRMSLDETIALTRAMVEVGERIRWPWSPVMDKHCVGGLPGNRTTLLVVPIVAACGVVMPKTSSRAITSPAGTADTMETLAPVNLDMEAMRHVVEREGGCIAWGGAVQLSPADDVLIRVERPLDLDSDAQLIASVLSKKVAAGSERVLIDIPVGPTAKLRSVEAAQALSDNLIAVGQALGLEVKTLHTDGSQPVGRGIGPALEAHDVMAVLEGRPDAPQDLRERALLLAGVILEMAGKATHGAGREMARRVLDEGRALSKFAAICAAQGGMRLPGRAPHTQPVLAPQAGRITQIDNRRIARAAKLAGAPQAATAGVLMQVRLGERVEAGQPLFTLHAEAPGELAYAAAYVKSQADIVGVREVA